MLAVIHHSSIVAPALPGRPSDREAQACRAGASLLFGTRRAVHAQQKGARHAHLRMRKGCGPLARREVFFARPRPDRGAGLARSCARAGERPGTAETGERPTSRSAVRRLIEGNARYMSGVATRHGFPPRATLSSADKSFRRNLELCRLAHCARVRFRLFARRPLRLPGRLQLRQRRQSRELRIRRGRAKVPAPAGSPP